MVARTNKDTQTNAQDTLNTSQAEAPQPQQTFSQSVGQSVFDLFGGDLASHADGSRGVRAEAVLKELKEYTAEEKISNAWQMNVILHEDLPNGEMLAIYVVLEDQAYVHPVVFAEAGGFTQQTNSSVNGLAGNVTESKMSSAAITHIKGFKDIVLQHLNAVGFNKVRSVDNLAVCGCTLYHKGATIKVNNLIANASNDVFAILAAKTGSMNPKIRTVADFNGTDLYVDSVANAEKTNIHGQHVFSPVTITGTAKAKSTLEGSGAMHSVPVGEICGYMDFTPYAQQERQQEQMMRQQANNPTRVPSHKPFYVITDEEWGNFKHSTTTPENLLTLFMLLPSVSDGALWVPRVVNAADAGFNPLYDFASVGYDEADFNKAFDECHVPTKFDLGAQRKYAADFFSNVSVCMDVSLAGPNAGGLNLLLDGTQLNRMIKNLTGVNSNFPAIGQSAGRIPLGTYDYQGKKRDIRELLNYFAWSKYVNGDKAQLQRWHTWFVRFNGQSEERVFAERMKMAEEISNGTFELLDTAVRVLLDDAVIVGIRDAFASNHVNIRVNQQAIGGADVGYGFNGGFKSGMSGQQQQAGTMGMPLAGTQSW